MTRSTSSNRAARVAALTLAAILQLQLACSDSDPGLVDSAPPPADSTTDGPQLPPDTLAPDAGADTAAPPADAPAAAALQLFGFGDSVTDGFCASTGRDYVELLVQNTADYPDWDGRDLSSHYPSVTVSNRAVSGSTSCDWSASQLRGMITAERVEAEQYAVVITLGGNDLIHDYSCANPHECAAYCSTLQQAEPWAEAFRTRMRALLGVMREELEGVEIFLANIYDPTDGVGDIENAPIPLPPWPDGEAILGLFNQTLAELAAEAADVSLVDMRAAMLGHGIHHDDPDHPHYDADDPSYWYCANLEDPNNAGYHAIRAAFWAVIADRLGLTP